MVVSVESDVVRKMDLEPIVTSTGAALGAEVRGVDLKAINETEFAALERAWHDHQVLLVRGQTLSDQDLITFSRRFGDLDLAPIQETGRRFVDGLPEIYIVSNVTINGEPIGSLGAGEAVWHTDMSYLDVPPMASMLYAIEIPPAGGNTSFCSMYAVYDALSDDMKRRIANLKIKHDGTYNSGGYLRQGVTATDDPRTAPIRTPAAACSISAADATPTWWDSRSVNPKPCSTSCGARSSGRNSPGSMYGRSAISCCGTTAAPCIGATRSMPRLAGSCIARKSRAAPRRFDVRPALVRHCERSEAIQFGSLRYLRSVAQTLCVCRWR
jgi:taurine dioxygenase